MALPKSMLDNLNKQEPLFAQVKSPEDKYVAWVSIYPNIPISTNSLAYDDSKRYIVRRYEVMKRLYDKLVAMNRSLVESQANNYMRIYVRDEEELEEILSEWIDDLSIMVPHFQSNFPFE